MYSSNAETIQQWVTDNIPDIYDLNLHVQNENLPFLQNGKHDGHKLITELLNG